MKNRRKVSKFDMSMLPPSVNRSQANYGQPPEKGAKAPVGLPEAFPEKDDFRLGEYRVVEVKDDYLICKGYDPNANKAHHTPSAKKTINVAKPPMLVKTGWDGETVELIVRGEPTDVTYTYDPDETGLRTATATVDGEEIEEIERITPDYIVGSTINAVEIKRNASLDGCSVKTEDGGRITFREIGSTRCWATSLDE